MRQSFKLFAALVLVLLISAPALAGDTGPFEFAIEQKARVFDHVEQDRTADFEFGRRLE